MNIVCRLKGHKFEFGYNHGIPLGDTRAWEEIAKRWEDGTIYTVYICKRCGSQAVYKNGKYVKHQYEKS